VRCGETYARLEMPTEFAQPETRYARSGDVHVAYQVVGDGPFDIVHVPPFLSHVGLAWEVPAIAAENYRLASFPG